MKKPKDKENLEGAILDQMRVLRKLQRIAGLPTSEILVRLARVWREGGDSDLTVFTHAVIRDLRRAEQNDRRERGENASKRKKADS